MIYRILVCGDRDWKDEDAVWRVLDSYLERYSPDQLLIIQGDARGADTMAKMWAEDREIDHLSFPARWKYYRDVLRNPRAAGPVRNKRMLTEGRPDLVIAFHDDIENSQGTRDMLKKAKRAGIPTRHKKHKKRKP